MKITFEKLKKYLDAQPDDYYSVKTGYQMFYEGRYISAFTSKYIFVDAIHDMTDEIPYYNNENELNNIEVYKLIKRV